MSVLTGLRDGSVLVSVAGIAAVLAAELPAVAEVFPADSKLRKQLLAVAVIASCVGTILDRLAKLPKPGAKPEDVTEDNEDASRAI